MTNATVIAPSVLSADFSDMARALTTIHRSGTQWIHLDVMDGHFVPNITFGHKMVTDLRPKTTHTLDVHLMVERPQDHIEAMIAAGADYVTFHIESAVHAHRLVQQIHERGAKAGIAVVPSTPLWAVQELLHVVDLVLVMTVNPGYGGQRLIPETLDKVAQARRLRDEYQRDFRIEVDGGINEETAKHARAAGADTLVSGSAFFAATDPSAYANRLRGDM